MNSAPDMTLEQSVDSLCCELCGGACAGEDGTPIAMPESMGAGVGGQTLMCCGPCAGVGKSFCNDGATLEPWTLADLREANAEDPEMPTWDRDLNGLAVGESYYIGIGGGCTVVTRVS